MHIFEVRTWSLLLLVECIRKCELKKKDIITLLCISNLVCRSYFEQEQRHASAVHIANLSIPLFSFLKPNEGRFSIAFTRHGKQRIRFVCFQIGIELPGTNNQRGGNRQPNEFQR